jgi:hypothetical protein
MEVTETMEWRVQECLGAQVQIDVDLCFVCRGATVDVSPA